MSVIARAATLRLRAMVIVVRNARVNRFSRSGGKACAAGIFAIFGTARGARVYIPFIANLKLPFKFDRPYSPQQAGKRRWGLQAF
jgi:hypothetical protein